MPLESSLLGGIEKNTINYVTYPDEINALCAYQWVGSKRHLRKSLGGRLYAQHGQGLAKSGGED